MIFIEIGRWNPCLQIVNGRVNFLVGIAQWTKEIMGWLNHPSPVKEKIPNKFNKTSHHKLQKNKNLYKIGSIRNTMIMLFIRRKTSEVERNW